MEITIKSFALFFILQAGAILVGSLGILILEKRVRKPYRARIAVISLVVSVLLAVVATIILVGGVVSGSFRMIGGSFIWLMSTPAESFINVFGSVSLLLSLVASFFLLKEPKMPEIEGTEPISEVGGVPVRLNDSIPLALAFGIRKPTIVVSAEVWRDKEILPIAILHELLHVRLKHNLLKFLARTVLRLNFFNPLVHRLIDRLDVYCELECDCRTADLVGVRRYREFLEGLPSLAFSQDNYASSLGPSGVTTALLERLTELGREDRGGIAIGFIPAVSSFLFLATVILAGNTRCLTVCFLGY